MSTNSQVTQRTGTLGRLLAEAERAFRTLRHIQFDAPWQDRAPACRD